MEEEWGVKMKTRNEGKLGITDFESKGKNHILFRYLDDFRWNCQSLGVVKDVCETQKWDTAFLRK